MRRHHLVWLAAWGVPATASTVSKLTTTTVAADTNTITRGRGRELGDDDDVSPPPPSPLPPFTYSGSCDPEEWDGYDGVRCDGCAALVNVEDNGGGTCGAFCSLQGLSCVEGWDDEDGEGCSFGATV
eukprot:scaffold42688_cov61-Phaeocystis_antarctica.AAC.1